MRLRRSRVSARGLSDSCLPELGSRAPQAFRQLGDRHETGMYAQEPVLSVEVSDLTERFGPSGASVGFVDGDGEEVLGFGQICWYRFGGRLLRPVGGAQCDR